jgi:hypothetical protein
VARKLKSVSVQCRTERTFSLWNALIVFRFSVRRFCETNRLFDVEAEKTIDTIEDLRSSCTPTPHIVKQPRRTIA